jgi:hypothetical protein
MTLRRYFGVSTATKETRILSSRRIFVSTHEANGLARAGYVFKKEKNYQVPLRVLSKQKPIPFSGSS